MTELDDFRAQLNAAISHLDSVLDSQNVTSLSEVFLNVEPKFENEAFTSLCERALKVKSSKVFSREMSLKSEHNVPGQKTGV